MWPLEKNEYLTQKNAEYNSTLANISKQATINNEQGYSEIHSSQLRQMSKRASKNNELFYYSAIKYMEIKC